MKDRLALGLMISAFATSRVAAYIAGVRFDATPLTWYWQYIDPALLKDRLFESVYYSHTQPPLFNLVLGITLKLFPSRFAEAMHVQYLALGLIATIALYVLLRQLGLTVRVSAVLAVLCAVSPATLLYENWLFYEYPTMALLLLAAVALHRFLARDSVPAGVAFFTLGAALIYTRTIFQIVWLLIAIGVLTLQAKTWASSRPANEGRRQSTRSSKSPQASCP